MGLVKQKQSSFWKYDNQGYNFCPICEGHYIQIDNQTVLWGEQEGKLLISKDNKTYCPYCGVRIVYKMWHHFVSVVSVLPLLLYLFNLPEPARENVNGWMLLFLVALWIVPTTVSIKHLGTFADPDDTIKVDK